MEPQTDVFRARRFRADFVARIFNIDADLLQMSERLAQRRHVRQMKRHVLNRFRRRLSFKQRDRDGVVANRHAVVEFELFLQTQSAFEPLRTLLRIAYSQAKVADFSKFEGNLHLDRQARNRLLGNLTPTPEHGDRSR